MKIEIKKFRPIKEDEYICNIQDYKVKKTDEGEVTGINFRLVVIKSISGLEDFKGRVAYFNTDTTGETSKLYNFISAICPDANSESFDLDDLIKKQIVVSMKQGSTDTYPQVLNVASIKEPEHH